MRREGFGVKIEPGASQLPAQFIHQFPQPIRRFPRPRPGNPVMRPAAPLRNLQAESWKIDFARQRDQFLQPSQFYISEENQGQMDRLPACSPPPTNPMQTFPRAGQFGRN